MSEPGTVAAAVRCLLGGGVALLPTDTVYGLAVHPAHGKAVDRLFALKGRPRTRNLPVMVADSEEVAPLGGMITRAAELLLESKYVPGPLTLAVGISPETAATWLAGRTEFAFRIPDDERLLSILKTTGPLLVTSANLHAQETRESVPDILASLTGEPDLVIDDGVRATVPSTLVNCHADPPVVERVGAVPTDEIEAILA
ncbi:MAG TPA: L-threonylcarbamoyladenylate synthase [Streptosporangiaceae bacterium]